MMYHLSKADTHDGKCNKDTPDHSSLVQIFCSMTSLGDVKFYDMKSLTFSQCWSYLTIKVIEDSRTWVSLSLWWV